MTIHFYTFSLLLLSTVAFAQEKAIPLQPQAPQKVKSSTSSILEPGDTAPDFSLKAADGKTYSLKDTQGKIVVLEWFNNECPFVEKHYGTNNMQKLQEKYKTKGVVWYTISSTKPKHALTPEDANKIIKARAANPTALLLDSDGNVARNYHAQTTPHMFVIDKNGKIIYNGAIDDNPSFQKDTVEKARNYVSEVLDSLLDSKSKKPIKDAMTKPYGCSVKI